MDRFIEFALNHIELSGGFLVLLVAFLVLESRRGGASVTPQKLSYLVNKEDAVILDIRETNEYDQGHITDAMNIPFTKLQQRTGELNNYKEKPVILVCKMGQHSGAAGRILAKNGFKDVRRLSGGVSGWTSEGLPLVKS